MKVIGFAGYARSGKDTAASFLNGFEKIAFADSLRDLAKYLNPYFKEAGKTYLEILAEEGYEQAKARPYIRNFLVTVGAGARKFISKDVWLQAAFVKIDECVSRGVEGIVITDVRYRNEAEAIQKNGGKIVMLVRPGVEPAHAEEARSLSEINPDYVIVNDSTPEELGRKVRELL